MKIRWNDVKDKIKTNKKRVGIILFIFLYIIFWLWYFGEKDISLEEVDLTIESRQEEKGAFLGKKALAKKNDKKEFSKEDLGNFWLEISTEDVKVKAPIVDGIEPEDLDRGLGRHRTTSTPGKKGNMVISGHRWKWGRNPAYKVFEDLDKLKNGNKILVHYGGKIFEYEVYKNGTVGDNKSGGREVLEKTDKRVLTLYTCTPKYTSFKRLYYRAKFIREIK